MIVEKYHDNRRVWFRHYEETDEVIILADYVQHWLGQLHKLRFSKLSIDFNENDERESVLKFLRLEAASTIRVLELMNLRLTMVQLIDMLKASKLRNLELLHLEDLTQTYTQSSLKFLKYICKLDKLKLIDYNGEFLAV